MFYQPQLDMRPEEVIVYLRKSRSDDPLMAVEEVLAKHETILDEWAVKHLGDKVPEENKFREVVSGETIEDRPEMKKLLHLIEKAKYKAVLVVEVQRLSRGDLEDAGRLIKLFRFTNTLILSPQKNYSLQDEYDRDAFERELKRGNEFLEYQKKIMLRGRLLSVSQGNYIGSVAPYGYDKHTVEDGRRKCPTLKINEYEATAIRMIFDMYVNQDAGRYTIARKLTECGFPPNKAKGWNESVVKDIITNPVYIGKVRWNWRKSVHIVEDGEIIVKRPRQKVEEYLIFEGKHEAIIDEQLFYAAQTKIGKNARVKSEYKLRNPFVTLIYCQCGRIMNYQTFRNKDGNVRAEPRLTCTGQQYCGTSSCSFSEMMVEIKKVLRQCIADFEYRIKNDDVDARKLHHDLIIRMKEKLQELERKEIRLWEKYTDEKMPKNVFDKLISNLTSEKDELQKALCKAEDAMPEPVDYEEKCLRFQTALDALDDPNVSVERKNLLLKACIERIEYNRGKSYRMTREEAVKLGLTSARGRWNTPPMELNFKLRL